MHLNVEYFTRFCKLNSFCGGLPEKTNFASALAPESLEFSILVMFSIFKGFYTVKIDI